jgi:flagellar hook protein FlgE
MIQGDGFFIAKSGGESLYTRAGSFTFDANGSLTTPNGQIVQGWTADAGVVNTAGAPGNIKLPIGVSLSPVETTSFTLTGNLSFELAGPASAKTIPVPTVDENGQPGTLDVVLTRKTDPLTGLPELGANGHPCWIMTLPDTSTREIEFPGGKALGGSLPPVPGEDTKIITMGIAPNTYTIDIHDLTTYAGLTEARVSASNGSGAGILSSYTVSNTGQIVGVFSNGLKQTLGQLALANFNNVNGLEKIGDSMFRSTVNSGLAQVGAAGSAGLGLITSGALEMSNVDLAQEFTNLVIAQRGFQANSRIITTSDEILQELVNLKR